jgi:hypothetical protein
MNKKIYHQGDAVVLKVVCFKDAAGAYFSREINATVRYENNGAMFYDFEEPQFGREQIPHYLLYSVLVLKDVDDLTHMFVPEDADIETIREAFADKAKQKIEELRYWIAYWESVETGTKYISNRTLK